MDLAQTDFDLAFWTTVGAILLLLVLKSIIHISVVFRHFVLFLKKQYVISICFFNWKKL